MKKIIVINCFSLFLILSATATYIVYFHLSPLDFFNEKFETPALKREIGDQILICIATQTLDLINKTNLNEFIPDEMRVTGERTDGTPLLYLSDEELKQKLFLSELERFRLSTDYRERNFYFRSAVDGILSDVIQHKKHELAAFNWEDRLVRKNIEETFRRGIRFNSADVDTLFSAEEFFQHETVEEKIYFCRSLYGNIRNSNSFTQARILEYFMASLGEDAIPALLEEYDLSKRNDPDFWAYTNCIERILGKLLKEKHKEIILQYYNDYDIFSHLICTYKFTEAEELITEKILSGDKNRYAIEIALTLDHEKFRQFILDNLNTHSLSPDILLKLSTIRQPDDSHLFREAITSYPYLDKQSIQLIEILLKQGKREGFELLLPKLDPDNIHDFVALEDLIRYYTGIRLRKTEIVPFLRENAQNFKWKDGRWTW